MKTRQKLLSSAMFLACGVLSSQVQAALPVDPVLIFSPGVVSCAVPLDSYGNCNVPQVLTGSYFGMDTNGNSTIASTERTAISMNDGLRIGTSSDAIQAASGTHSGAPTGSEAEGADNAWSFFGNTGLHYTNVAASIISSTTSNTAILDFSGWGVTWNGIPAINMGSGAWGTAGFVSGQAQLVCAVDCAIGDTFTLDYRATVPAGDPSNFGGVRYTVHLEGTIGGFNTPPVTTAFSIGVLSTTAVPTPGVAGPISLTGNVTDTQDILTNDNVFTGSTPVISNPSSNIAANCTPTAVTANANGTVTFPACSVDGNYTFDFAFSDAYETSNVSTVTVTVSGDPAPNAVADTAIADGVTPEVISVLANDTDNNIDATSVAVITNGAHGTATVVNGATDTVSYTANAGYAGTDTFTYTVNDLRAAPGPQTSNTATVTVTVNALNTPASSATFTAASGSTNGIVTMAQIGVPDTGTFPEDDIAQSCIGGCFDFTLSGVTGTASVVLPLNTAVPAKADGGNTITYRKLINGAWRSFDTTTDTFQSAPGTVTGSDVSCPPAGDPAYTGLTTGHRCLLLTITDNGPNDADATVGTIADPGGLAEITRVVGTDGCSMTGNNSNAADHADWLLLAGFMAMLGWFGMKRRQA